MATADAAAPIVAAAGTFPAARTDRPVVVELGEEGGIRFFIESTYQEVRRREAERGQRSFSVLGGE